ncbi:MAG TPA: sensor domain-containing diguanylate cyclase [Steroidobacteraceae bacterium]|nr:sensor domain-containing diguanylate cyclase [Steroidobacteraceae bacterium]
MPQPDFLQTETLRLVAVQKADLLNTPLESRFNRIVRLARQALGVRAATIGLFDEEREWIKAADGWELRQLPLSQSLAAQIARGAVPAIIKDTQQDDRCRENRLVTHPPRVRFCAVFPLRDRVEHVIGAFAAYDTEPRPSADGSLPGILADVGYFVQRELLLADASSAQDQLLLKLGAARRQAMLDDLTRLWNRRGALQLLEHAIAESARLKTNLGVCIADLDRFKEVNDTYGHAGGDLALKKVAAALVDNVRPGDMVCRVGGEEFLLIFPAVTASQLPALLERVRAQVAAQVVRVRGQDVHLTLSLGGYVHAPPEATTTDDLLRRVDEALYRAKGAGRNVVVIS